MAAQSALVPTSASSTFPSCALGCSILLTAQTYCLPPSVADSEQLAYDQCFCQSAYLTPLLSMPDSVCTAECTVETDRQLLQTWYNSFCAQVRAGVVPATATATQNTGQSSVTIVTQTTTSDVIVATTTRTPTSGQTGTPQKHEEDSSWIGQHWKAILLVAIIAVALVAFACLGVWLKRRHRRKVDEQRARASGFDYGSEKSPKDFQRSATPDLWGPHQMQHATNGFGYDADLITASEQKRRSAKRNRKSYNRVNTIEVTEITAPAPTRASVRRARPSELEMNARMIGAADRSRSSSGKAEKTSIIVVEKDVESVSEYPK